STRHDIGLTPICRLQERTDHVHGEARAFPCLVRQSDGAPLITLDLCCGLDIDRGDGSAFCGLNRSLTQKGKQKGKGKKGKESAKFVNLLLSFNHRGHESSPHLVVAPLTAYFTTRERAQTKTPCGLAWRFCYGCFSSAYCS